MKIKSFINYLIIFIIIIAVCTYFLGEQGFLGSLLAALGIGGNAAINGLKKDAKELDEKAEVIKEEIKEIDKKLDEPVKELTPEEEKDYWKNQ